MNRPDRLVWLAVAMLSTLLIATESPARPEVVGESVREELASHDRVRVVIALWMPSALEAAPLEQRMREISRTQDDVLTALDEDEFLVRYRYDAVPAPGTPAHRTWFR